MAHFTKVLKQTAWVVTLVCFIFAELHSYRKMASKRVTQLRLYRIALNDSRLCSRVQNVEEIFDKHYICIVKISNQISKLWPEGNKMAIYREELNSG